MRGEYCVYGATALSAMSIIMLVFAHIGQISSGAVTSGIYMAKVDVSAFGNAYVTAKNVTAAGLYDSKNDKLGASLGLRQTYRYGLYNACAYQKTGTGICNATTFAYPMEPLNQIVADTPSKYKAAVIQIIPTSTFKDNSLNHGLTRAGSAMIFVGSVFALVALITGVFKARLLFFVAAISSGIGALFMMIGAAMWTAIIAKDDWLKIVKVEHGALLGIYTTAGASLYLVWVSFAMTTLSVLPYVVACCTYRKM